VHIRALAVDELADRLVGFLVESGSPLAGRPELVRAAAPLVQEKMATLAEFEPLCRFLFERAEPEPEAWARLAGNDRAAEVLQEADTALQGVEEWTVPAVEAAVRAMAERLSLKPRAAFTPIRVALTGQTVAPGLFESAHLLGREESLARLDAARRRLAAAPG
jgi:glutamyl-tRNA synthetase